MLLVRLVDEMAKSVKIIRQVHNEKTLLQKSDAHLFLLRWYHAQGIIRFTGNCNFNHCHYLFDLAPCDYFPHCFLCPLKISRKISLLARLCRHDRSTERSVDLGSEKYFISVEGA